VEELMLLAMSEKDVFGILLKTGAKNKYIETVNI
jgi:hypothetical protein